jgi:uroporphyrinogen decarboxylase
MTSRQRILTTLSHREPDRVPYDLGAIGPSGISFGAYKKLVSYLALNETPQLGDFVGQRANPSETFLQRFGVDTRPLRYGPQRAWKRQVEDQEGYFFTYDEWGIGQKKSKADGQNYFIFHHPLAQVGTDDLPNFPWPNPVDPGRLEGMAEKALDFKEKGDPAIVLGGSLSQGLLQFAAQLEGHERFFTNLALDPYRVECLLEKLLKLKLNFYSWALTSLREWVDIVSEADDLGYQNSQWVSPEMFRKFIKPRYAKLFSTLKNRFGVKILFHSCGAVYPFIPDLVETGVDILNPIQLGAAGMGDTRRLKKEFGDVLTFWGGGIDVQQMLPVASPQTIEDEVKRRIEDLAPGGGFIFAATQTIQPDTPPENIMAMWKGLQRYGSY